MNLRRMPAALFWAAMVAAPIAISFIAIAQFPRTPLSRSIGTCRVRSTTGDRLGGLLPPSLIMASANLLFALMYRSSDWLYDHGLVHGISRKATRPSLCGEAIFMVALSAGVSAYWVFRASTSM